MNYFCESPSNWLFSAPSDECTVNEVREENNDEHYTFGDMGHQQHQTRRIVNPMVDVNLENDDDEDESESDASSIFRQTWNSGKIACKLMVLNIMQEQLDAPISHSFAHCFLCLTQSKLTPYRQRLPVEEKFLAINLEAWHEHKRQCPPL